MTKGNPTLTTHTALASSANTRDLIRLNVHLRANGVDGRYVSATKVGAVVMVPPDQHQRAGELRDAWLENQTDLLEDWAKLKELEGDLETR